MLVLIIFQEQTSYEEGKKEAEFLYNNCLKGKTFEYSYIYGCRRYCISE